MVDPRTLRGRLGLAYAVALALALVVFAAVTLLVLDSVQRRTLDDRLYTASNAVLAIVDTKTGTIDLDDNDRRQFAQIVGSTIDGAVLTGTGTAVASTVSALPGAVEAAVRRPSGDVTLSTASSAGDTIRILVRDVRTRSGRSVGAVALWQSTQSIVQLDTRLAIAFALMIPILALVAVIAGSEIARRGLRPLESMSAAAAEIEGHDLSRRIDTIGAPTEIERLASAFNRMLDRLEAAFGRQRRFTADASHELRTPLSVIRAEADLALMRDRNAAEYRTALRTIAREADNLEALTRDLLAVARADARAMPTDAVADLGSVASDVVDRMRLVASAGGMTLAADEAPALACVDAVAVARVAASLVQNALKYGRPGGTVTVFTLQDGDWATLVVRDDGAGFSPEALIHGSERFWRGSGARADDGAGLGLAIARAVVESFGGTIVLANHPGGGAMVTVRLRAARVPIPS